MLRTLASDVEDSCTAQARYSVAQPDRIPDESGSPGSGQAPECPGIRERSGEPSPASGLRSARLDMPESARSNRTEPSQPDAKLPAAKAALRTTALAARR